MIPEPSLQDDPPIDAPIDLADDLAGMLAAVTGLVMMALAAFSMIGTQTYLR